MAAQQALQAFVDARAADLAATQAYVGQLVASRGWAPPDDAQLAALASTALLAVAINVLLMLLVPKGRKLVFDTVETVLAIALIVVLLAVVLGLPLGIIYLVLKAVAFLLNLVLGIPAVAGVVASLRSTVGL
ncbi:hypothetical protein C2E21_7719 [Chlorella sorokiniana]|uniref:ABC transmembrane type-1 domain-containing protein n=2 Tax=Chlorella TaxID=3071 RepID=A0A2P6TH51_CHLSO|nr:hypothetical protein C2E21_7719 [Chlorella sorokiniana]|eukprot:PRW33611.1 hypothetical protein C2E21_7719 [Chlorella sorokiniana]